ncbi:MAG TPA: hypothetical protein VF598_10165 [Hymenobacter sp.]
MARLIEMENLLDLPARVRLEVGDVLLFPASGGRVQNGTESLAFLGAFLPGLLQPGGEILSPMGAPNTVLFHAHSRGQATIAVMAGDPWQDPITKILEVIVVA